MAVTKKDVEKIAELARLKFTDEELENFTPQMNEILSYICLLYTSPSPRDRTRSRMPSSA